MNANNILVSNFQRTETSTRVQNVQLRYNYTPLETIAVPVREADSGVRVYPNTPGLASMVHRHDVPDVAGLVEAVAQLQQTQPAPLPVQYNGPAHPEIPTDWSPPPRRGDAPLAASDARARLSALITASGLSQAEFARHVLAGRDPRSLRRYLAGDTIPPDLVTYIAALVRVDVTPERVSPVTRR